MNRIDFEIGLAHLILYNTAAGNLNVADDHICPDGYRLGVFVSTVRVERDLSVEQAVRLCNIGFSFDKDLQSWETMFRLASEYVSRCGGLPDWYYQTEDNVLLGAWVWRQAERCLFLSEEQKKKLASIGIAMD